MAGHALILDLRITSAIVDNILYTATLLPITMFLTKTMPGRIQESSGGAVSGACFGGNGTIIGASANVVTTGIMEKPDTSNVLPVHEAGGSHNDHSPDSVLGLPANSLLGSSENSVYARGPRT
jgi:hypothetical protein